MCTDKKKAVLWDFRAKMEGIIRLPWHGNIQNEKRQAIHRGRLALSLNCYFVNYRLATARHGFRSAKLLNFLFTLIKFKFMIKKEHPTLRAVYLILLYGIISVFCQSDDVTLRLQRHLDGGFLVHVLLVEQQQTGTWQRIEQIACAVLRG